MPRTHQVRTNGKTHEEVPPAGQHLFTNSAGKSYEIQGVSPWAMESLPSQLTAEWEAAGRHAPAAPTYTVKTVGGEDEVHEHDETTLETDADREAWAAYVADQDEWNRALQERMLRNIIMDGVVAVPTDDRWIARHKFMGRTVPDDEFEREMYWKRTEVIRSAEDAAALMSAVLSLTGVSEEQIRIAEKSFRGEVEKPDGPGADRAAT